MHPLLVSVHSPAVRSVVVRAAADKVRAEPEPTPPPPFQNVTIAQVAEKENHRLVDSR